MKSLVLWIALLGLAACGGGGGGDGNNGGGGGGGAQNTPPTANAGPDQNAAENTTVALAGQGADADGDAITYAWSQVSGPTVSFADTSDPATDIELPAVAIGTTETVVLSLRVSDSNGASATDEVTFTVSSTDYVVFVAGADELFKYDPETGQTTKLSAPLVAGGAVSGFRISPDGQWVAYAAAQDIPDLFELYVAAVDGSGVTKLSEPFQGRGDVRSYDWSPDSTQLVYTADAEIDDVSEVYLVNVDGSDHVKINGSVGVPAVVFLDSVIWSPDGRYIAQRVRNLSDRDAIGINVYDTEAGMPNSTRLNPPVVAGGEIRSYSWAPDSSRISYSGPTETVDLREVFTVRPDGSDHVKINPPIVSGGAIVTGGVWSPDSSQLAYMGDINTAGVRDVYVTQADGSVTNTANQAGDQVISFVWSPDGQWLAFATNPALNVIDWIRARPDGSDRLVINDGNSSAPRWTSDSQRFAFTERVNGEPQLFVMNTDGTGKLQVNTTIPMGGQVWTLSWSPTNDRLVYNANPTGTNNYEYFTVRPDASEDIQLNRTLLGNVTVGRSVLPKWSADGSRLIYMAPQDDPNVSDLYLGSPDGIVNVRLTATPETAAPLSFFEFSP